MSFAPRLVVGRTITYVTTIGASIVYNSKEPPINVDTKIKQLRAVEGGRGSRANVLKKC